MGSISVLLVDDNYTFLHIAERFLQEQDDLVVAGAFSEGEEALAQARDLRPDIVLVDLAMPSLPGLEVSIKRSWEIEVQGFDAKGREYTSRFHGLWARVIQHEIDHLDGILINDKALRPGSQGVSQ